MYVGEFSSAFLKVSSKIRCGIFLYLLGAFFSLQSLFAKTAANTEIQNLAVMSYSVDGNVETTYSNTTSFRVDELLSFTLTADNPTGVFVQSPSTGAVLVFTLTNQGNGQEKFDLSVTQSITDEFNPSVTKIYLDSNSNGIYDPTTDLLYTPGTHVPDLAPNASLQVFLVSDIPSALNPEDEALMSLVVSPATGSGPFGTPYLTLGDGGVDAVMGSPGGNFAVEGKLIVEVAEATITKSQSILDPDGGSASVKDAVITYTLNLQASGVGTLTDLVISDNIPSGTVYVENSLRLDGSPLSDAEDADSGLFTGTAVRVNLPTLVAPATHNIVFKVRIL